MAVVPQVRILHSQTNSKWAILDYYLFRASRGRKPEPGECPTWDALSAELAAPVETGAPTVPPLFLGVVRA